MATKTKTTPGYDHAQKQAKNAGLYLVGMMAVALGVSTNTVTARIKRLREKGTTVRFRLITTPTAGAPYRAYDQATFDAVKALGGNGSGGISAEWLTLDRNGKAVAADDKPVRLSSVG